MTKSKKSFCSKECFRQQETEESLRQRVTSPCTECGTPIDRKPCRVKQSRNLFCSKSCAAIFNNKRRKRTRRSKIEARFFEELQKTFPSLEMIANDQEMLDGMEVDIAIPSLQLAIEWNGIVHFKPIYGEDVLSKIQSKDKKKMRLASKSDIHLLVISDYDSAEKTFQRALREVSEIVGALIETDTSH